MCVCLILWLLQTISTCFRSHDSEKRQNCEQHVREVERGSFTPPPPSYLLSTVDQQKSPTKLTLASLLATKIDQHYNIIISLIHAD